MRGQLGLHVLWSFYSNRTSHACTVKELNWHVFQVDAFHGSRVYTNYLPTRSHSKARATASWAEVVLDDSFVELIRRQFVQRFRRSEVESISWSVHKHPTLLCADTAVALSNFFDLRMIELELDFATMTSTLVVDRIAVEAQRKQAVNQLDHRLTMRNNLSLVSPRGIIQYPTEPHGTKYGKQTCTDQILRSKLLRHITNGNQGEQKTADSFLIRCCSSW